MGFPGFRSSDLGLTVIPFDADDIGIEFHEFVKQVGPSFGALKPDFYDVRREQGALIEFFDHASAESAWERCDIDPLRFYAGECSDEQLQRLFLFHGTAVAKRLSRMQPYRSKARAQYRAVFVNFLNLGWEIRPVALEPISQNVGAEDLRSVPRVYEEIAPEVRQNTNFLRLLEACCGFVKSVESDVCMLDIGAWQVRLVTDRNGIASNAPEGIHQDGADYIVSAFVMNRENATGGESIVYKPDRTKYLSTTLMPKQGLFQADKPGRNFELWHDVTPVCPDEFGVPAVRDTFGLDFKIVGRYEK